jgi:hypothetical protein
LTCDIDLELLVLGRVVAAKTGVGDDLGPATWYAARTGRPCSGSASGRLWRRADDTFGLAGLVNHISAARLAYLDAGGLTPIIGDGRLPNPGNEQIIEAYYSVPIWAWRLTADIPLPKMTFDRSQSMVRWRFPLQPSIDPPA